MPVKMGSSYDPFPRGFCSDSLWDLNKTWYTDDPDFTDCFHQTVLVWVPCLFLWLMLLIQYYAIISSPHGLKKWTWLPLTKIILCFLLLVMSVVDLSLTTHQWLWKAGFCSAGLGARFTASVLKIATWFLSLGYIYSDRKRARTSAILWFFWLFMLLTGVLGFRHEIANQLRKRDWIGCVVHLPTVFIQFVLSCLGEPFPEIENQDKNPCPERHASFSSRLIFAWFDRLAYLGWKRPLEMRDLWDLLEEDRTKFNVDILERNWKAEMDKRNRSLATKSDKKAGEMGYQPSLTMTLWRTYRFQLLSSGFLRVFNDISVFITPQLLSLLIGFVEDPSGEKWKGYLYASLMLLGAITQTLILNYYLHICFRIGMNVRGSVAALVYRKALKLTSHAKRVSSMGEIVNLQSVDAQRFTDFMAYIHVLWSAPLQIALAIYFLWNILGVAVMAGFAVLVFLLPLNAIIVARVRRLQLHQMQEKDGRIKIMTEILNGIKVLKLYAWEVSFQKQVTKVRHQELVTLKKAAYLNILSHLTWMMSPFLVALATFTTYLLIDPLNHILTAQRVFVALSLLNILRTPLTLLPTTITMAIQVSISIRRLAKFLRNEELDSDNLFMLAESTGNSVLVSDGSFAWGRDEETCLKNINVNIPDGQLVAVVGPVGSGKSSLCSALLGLMEKLSGEVGLKGKMAYVPQQAWIQNLTLKENILFGGEMQGVRYKETLEACSLPTDLAMLEAGDETEIGERGTNLSGGQRQRVSLARAVYSDADVYILDDPLSAVDAHVGQHIFENVIGPRGMLKKKTRVFVTHGIGYLPQCDLVIVLEGGTIREMGSYAQLLRNHGAFSQLMQTYQLGKIPEEGTVMVCPSRPLRRQSTKVESIHPVLRSESISSASTKIRQLLQKGAKSEEKKGILVVAESSETGGVKWSVYWLYLQQMSWRAAICLAICTAAGYGLSMGQNFWLGQWALDSGYTDRVQETEWRDYRLGVYASLGISQAIFVAASSFCLAYGHIRASKVLHKRMLQRIMRAPMAFFDTTPLGRIVNRFSKDTDTIDVVLPATINVWLYCAFTVLSTVIVITVNTPPFAALILPLGLFYFFMQRYFISTSRQLKRLEGVTRSPIFSHFQESVSGSSVIIATRQIQRFIRQNENLVDINNASYYPNIVSQRWIAVRLEFVGICVSFSAALFAVVGRDLPSLFVSPDKIGLTISYSLAINQILNWFVRMTSDMESNIVSVERMKEYSQITTEAEWISPSKRPSPNWPTAGHLQLVDYKTRYRPNLHLVLKGLSADILPGEKIGIVGRTGAGKSSLTLALFRLIEAAEGAILIDGINIADLGLHDVRSRLTILPQEAVLFSGTLRLNLDPFSQFSDAEVWLALKNSHLQEFVSALPLGLEHVVADGGENYSVGQRQLICLARALLKKTKFLILDEATAAIDLQTDHLLQETIRREFAECTILTIAHRINTIMDSTRIMVLDGGRVKEFDTPQALLKNEESLFYRLAKSANVVA